MSSRGGNRLRTGETSDVPNDQFPNFQLSCFSVDLRLRWKTLWWMSDVVWESGCRDECLWWR